MAPALPLAPREPLAYDRDAVEDTEPFSHRRRALASVDNLATHMEEDDMGLQTQPSLAKDSQEMEQILVDLGSSDLAQADLLQAIKTLESGGDALSTGDADAIFPGFDLPETADSEGDAGEDKIKTVQARLERRCAFLQRRLRILQARAMGKRVSEEVAQTFERSTRGARKDGGGRPVGLKAFLKRIETTAALQASAASRNVAGPKYYHAGTSKGDASKSASIGIASGTLTGLEETAGALKSHLSVVKHELDSDATASSSGAESNDEAVVYNNPQQQHMPIEKRALWTWQRERASIASRWCWLQAQVQELDYKIRQHNELHKQVREQKGPVEFEGSPVGYEGSLPGSDADNDPATQTCARVRPLRRETFKKRKLLQMHNLHIATDKAAKPSDIKCSCMVGVESCGVCTGRSECTQPAAPHADRAARDTIALIDPGYHPVLSDIRDVSPSVHMSAVCSRSWFRPRVSRTHTHTHTSRHTHSHSHTHTHPHTHTDDHSYLQPQTPKPLRRHPTRLKRGRPPLSRKIRERERDEETSTSGQERRRLAGRSSTETRWRRGSYDIDNIVIPQSVAASTRPQILTYKEIITPKWRVLDIPEAQMNNGVMKTSSNQNRVSIESDEEDISEAAVAARHNRAETRERGRYLRKQRSRRSNHDDGRDNRDNHDNRDDDENLYNQHLTLRPAQPVPDPAPASAPAPAPMEHETVRPYTPRQFPLAEDAYIDMLSVMPDGYRASSCDQSPDTINTPLMDEDDNDNSSTLSPMSPIAFDGDDPDDVEWDPSNEKADRRKSSFR